MVDTRLRAEKRILSGTAPTVKSLDLMTNDHILLCSDGLTDMLTDKDIKDIVKGKDLEKDTHQLVNYALEKGGLDNVSVILLKIP
jgi:protein phosphatase